MEKFARRLNDLCEKSNYSKKDVSKKLGFSENTFGQYTRGDSNPDLETLIKISEVFGVSIEYLLRGKEFKHDEVFTTRLNQFKILLSIFKRANIEQPFILDVENWKRISNEDIENLTAYFYFTVDKAKKEPILELT